MTLLDCWTEAFSPLNLERDVLGAGVSKGIDYPKNLEQNLFSTESLSSVKELLR